MKKILAKWISRQQPESKKKRRWLRYLDLIIVFGILQVTILLMLLVHSSSTSVTTASSSSTSKTETTSLAAPQIPQQTQNKLDPPSAGMCTDPQRFEGKCLEGVFNDDGNDYKGGDKDTGPIILNPIADGTAIFFYTPYKYTVDNPQIIALWGGVLILVDAFIVLLIMINGIRLMLAGIAFRFDKAIESLPNVLLAIVVAHVSLLFISTLLGLNNILIGDTYTWASDTLFRSTNDYTNGIPKSEGNDPYHVDVMVGIGAIPFDTWGNAPVYDNLPQKVKDKYCHKSGWKEYFTSDLWHGHITGVYRCKDMPIDVLVRSQLMQDNLNFTGFFDNLQDLGNALGVLLKIMALMLMAQMIIRLFFINLYIITAPLGIGCWALPGKTGQSITGLWLKGFISTVLVQFVMVVALIVIQVMVAAILHFVLTPATTDHDMTKGPGGLDVITLTNLMCICFLWFLVRVPGLLGTAPMRTMVQAGQSMAQVVNTTMAIQMAEAQMVVQGAGSALSFFR
ncbi:hypothetical protein [Ktedonospora formicarum]|uniref:Uncharacterized protein n=1 Tax=Ktedonospora formicarum TaxID=2778364 RepID=A0A8J3MPC9_9CHLR|nr:hypothetical protein [Ktedonospora formicarum]GHO42790.1 hypothetical protein KSX_09530 [Ktedonospora formicarum]